MANFQAQPDVLSTFDKHDPKYRCSRCCCRCCTIKTACSIVTLICIFACIATIGNGIYGILNYSSTGTIAFVVFTLILYPFILIISSFLVMHLVTADLFEVNWCCVLCTCLVACCCKAQAQAALIWPQIWTLSLGVLVTFSRFVVHILVITGTTGFAAELVLKGVSGNKRSLRSRQRGDSKEYSSDIAVVVMFAILIVLELYAIYLYMRLIRYYRDKERAERDPTSPRNLDYYGSNILNHV